jgi:protein TonB
MTYNIQGQKSLLFFLFAALPFLSIMSCNSESSSAAKNSPDTTATAAVTDSMATTVHKTRKGKVSAMMSADNTNKTEKDKDGVYNKTEVKPAYPGGEAALSKFIGDNINYPQDAIDQNVEGTSTISFIVDEKGMVTKPIVSGQMTGHGLDDEAMRVVAKMPEWKPGMVKGRAVKTRMLLPVTFKLSE